VAVSAREGTGHLPEGGTGPARKPYRIATVPGMSGAVTAWAGARLPADRSSFVGRRSELAELRRLLADARLVTLVGPGGVGKTRLALRAAADLRRSFPGGAALADLTAVDDPALVVQHVAAALDVRDVSSRWLGRGLAEIIGARQLLLVLDNCEHVRDACAVLVAALLDACPGLRVVATSRRPLDIGGESLLIVPPLGVPAPGEHGDGARHEAVALLEQRAGAAAATHPLRREDAAVVGELCRRLDGIPLAIELAAVRLRTLGPAELLARLDDRFRLLGRSGVAGPRRHRTLRATMEWSHDLLDPIEQVLWRRAAVFAAEFDLASAEAVCADATLTAPLVLDGITALVDASVLDVVRGPAGSRFRMLETVRAFGREMLDASGQAEELRARHRDRYAGLAADAAHRYVAPDQVAAFDRLTAEHAELAAALAWSLSTQGEEDAGVAMAADLWLYWEARGHVGEGRRWLDLLLSACPPEHPARVRGLAAAGFLALAATDTDAALPLLEEALARAEATGEEFVAAFATQYLGQAALFRGDLPAAERLLRAAADRHRRLDPRYAAFAAADLGVAALLRGDPEAAAEAFSESLALNAGGGDPWTRSHALWGLGLVRLRNGAPEEAVRMETEALQLMREVDDRSGTALCVVALAWAAAELRQDERAARLLGAAEAVWRSIPAEPPAPVTVLGQEYTAAARDALGERRWAARSDEGRALDRRQAVALALGERPGPSSAAAAEGRDDLLTPRQRQVAGLVAQGLTDRQIAARLVISPRTAESHVEQILTRLAVRSRAEIAAWAVVQPSSPPS
jgi:predicted ATPase/DNA-binding CsgD family transcriptional regulator